MSDKWPICPHCATEVTYDGMVDEYFDTSTYEVNMRGTCPVCGRHFTWKEIYRLSHTEDFEEEIENG